MLWLNFERPARATGLAGLFVALGVLALAYGIATGSRTYPVVCNGRRVLICEMQNALYLIGGRPAAALPWFAFSVVIFYASMRAFRARGGFTN